MAEQFLMRSWVTTCQFQAAFARQFSISGKLSKPLFFKLLSQRIRQVNERAARLPEAISEIDIVAASQVGDIPANRQKQRARDGHVAAVTVIPIWQTLATVQFCVMVAPA